MSWYTAAELAGMRLPGLPATQQAIKRRAKQDGWHGRPRRARGGGTEYHVDSLPAAARAALHLRDSAAAASDPPSPAAAPDRPDSTHGPAPAAGEPGDADGEQARIEALWRRYERLPDRHKQTAERRLRAVQTVEALVAGSVRKTDAYAHVARETGEHSATLRRWCAAVRGLRRDAWLPALAPRWCGNPETADCDPRVWEAYKAFYLTQSKPPHSACYRWTRAFAEKEGMAIPSARTLKRRIERELPPEAVLLAREGPEALKRRYPAQQRDRAVFHALEAVNADGHTFDVFVKWPDGTVARPKLLAWQDIHSGKILSWRLGATENADLVRLALGDLVETYGIPDRAYLDNGRAFASKWLTGGMAFRHRFKIKAEEPVGILTTLGVQVHWVTPYHGQAKPIERAFRDLCDTIAKHPACEGAYTGNSPDAKPENYGSRAVALADFLQLVATEIRHHNARPNRRSQVCQGRMSFDDAFAASYAEAPIRRATEAQRRLWLLAAENVAVRAQDGTVHLLGNRYWSEITSRLAGKRVTVRFDPDDVQAGVHVYTPDGAHAGRAECIEAAGFNDTAAARDHARARKAWRKAHAEMLQAERRMSAAEAAAQLPDAPEPDQPARKVVRGAFPAHGNAAARAAQDTDDIPEEDVIGRALRGLRVVQGGHGEGEAAGD